MKRWVLCESLSVYENEHVLSVNKMGINIHRKTIQTPHAFYENPWQMCCGVSV